LKPGLVLCLGNEILGDDGFGAVVARILAQSDQEHVDVVFAPLAGFALLDLLAGRSRVLIVDTIQTGKFPPGTLHRFGASALAHSNHLINSHQISLPTALELGKRLGIEMPSQVDVLAVEAKDVHTLHEGLDAAVTAAVEEAICEINQWISSIRKEDQNGKDGKTTRDIPVGSA